VRQIESGSADSNETLHLGYPIREHSEIFGAVAIDLASRPQSDVDAIVRQLLLASGWLIALLRAEQSRQNTEKVARATAALSIVQAAQEEQRLDHCAIVVVNELATRYRADRVSLGVERRGQVHVRAVSPVAWFDRRSKIIASIENAMEEALDQEAVLMHPRIECIASRIVVAQRELAAAASDVGVLTVPLLSRGRAIGALTLERVSGSPFDEAALEFCELLGGLLGPVIDARREQERWLSGRLVTALTDFRTKLLGPRHPLLKLTVAAALIAAVLLCVLEGDFRVSAKTAIEGAVQRAAVAPFDGYVAEALVRAGDNVKKGQLLATLDDRDLKLERTKWETEREQADAKYHEAVAKRDRAGARVLAAQRSQGEAQLALVEEKLTRARLVAPFDGVVVSGDLSQLLGAPVELGKVLFELAPLDAYRVVVKVDERDIAYVQPGQHGDLALTGITGKSLPFRVKSITSVSIAQEGRNYFRVEAELQEASTQLRPGMEGVGKIVVGERKLMWIWTRNLLDWLRITFWTWMP
jgi:RND family efflux transporter MFP subunit